MGFDSYFLLYYLLNKPSFNYPVYLVPNNYDVDVHFTRLEVKGDLMCCVDQVCPTKFDIPLNIIITQGKKDDLTTSNFAFAVGNSTSIPSHGKPVSVIKLGSLSK